MIKPLSMIFTAVWGCSIMVLVGMGFNAGSAFGCKCDCRCGSSYYTVATSIAGLTWLVIEWIVYKKPTLLGLASGIVAGLVAITPAAGFVSIGGSMIIGLIGAIIGFFGVVVLKKKLGYDDSLDAFGIHFLAGLWGALATGLLALNDKELLWDGPLKADANRVAQFIVQLKSVLIVGAWTLVGTVIVYFIASA